MPTIECIPIFAWSSLDEDTEPPASSGGAASGGRSLGGMHFLQHSFPRFLFLAEPVKSHDFAAACWLIGIGNRRGIGGWGRYGDRGPRTLMVVLRRWSCRLAV